MTSNTVQVESLKTDLVAPDSVVGVSLLKRYAWIFSLAALVVFLFSLLGRYFFVAELMGNFRLQIACLMIPFAILAMQFGHRPLGWIMIVAIGWSFMTLGMVYVPATQPAPGNQSLKIMSFNVLCDSVDRDEALDVIESSDADVVVIVEYTGEWERKLKPLDKKYPYQIREPRWHGFGIAMFSKYPFEDSNVYQIAKKKTDNALLIANVKIGSQVIRLIGFHSISPTTPFRLTLRNEQFVEVANLISDVEIPTVVMGDMNCTPWSPFLKDFMKQTGLRDSRQGYGYHASWPNWMTLLKIPIDHALVSDDVHVHSRAVGSVTGSDHLPIMFEVSIAPNQKLIGIE